MTPLADISVCGNATQPKLQFLERSGTAVCKFAVARNRKKKDKQTDEWVDAGTDWFDIECWAQLAENVAASITKGMRVRVVGEPKFNTWEVEGDDGKTSTRKRLVITATDVCVSLQYATADSVVKNSRDDAPKGRNYDDYDPSEEPF